MKETGVRLVYSYNKRNRDYESSFGLDLILKKHKWLLAMLSEGRAVIPNGRLTKINRARCKLSFIYDKL